jgi:hypothetical protein
LVGPAKDRRSSQWSIPTLVMDTFGPARQCSALGGI